ncbi:MAG: helix-turn-helix domain-containing protein [Ruminococcaceae bacterium]|nr:helix-turn-helix domain-containing protein [Oscillospiraceae bacterium]
MKSIGKMIRAYRLQKQLSIAVLAEAVGVPEKTLIKWETGRAVPDSDHMQKLTDALDIPTAAWVDLTLRKLRLQNRILLVSGIALLLALLLSLGGIGIYARQYVRQMREIMDYVLYGGFGALESDYAVDVSMTELIATPERYHGVKVRLTAVGNLDFEGNYISASKEAWENHTNDQIWIELGEQLAPHGERLRRYNGEYVIIEGVFNMYDKGHFDMFQGALHDVTRYDLDDASLYDNCRVQYHEESRLYSYAVYDDRENVMISGENLEEYPTTDYVGMGIIGVSLPIPEDASVYKSVYCNVESGEISEQFLHVIEAHEGYVVYLFENEGQYSVVVQDIFDVQAYSKAYPLEDFNPDAKYPISCSGISAGGDAEIVYKSGENEQEKTLTVHLP